MLQSSGPFQVHRPRPPLAEFVDYVWIYEGYAPPHPRERLLPTATTELVFSVDANGRASSGVSGARSEPLVLDTSTPFSVIAVHFKPGGGFPFFGVPSSDLRNQGVTLDLVWGRLATNVRDRLWEETAADNRFKVLEEALLTRARARFDHHPAVRYALESFERSNGRRPVGDVIQRIGLSARRFGDVFLSEVGLSPKTFCRIRRFNEVLKRIEHDTSVDWSAVALSCGYFDQAHFNHDFRACAGVTPSAYLRDRMSRIHVGVSNT
jgi:AraC-like DNA-binding protein